MSKNLSAIKRVKISLRNRLRNKKYKVAIKKSIKSYLLNSNNNNIDVNILSSKLSVAYKRIDKAVKVGILHKNKAARKKASLYKRLINMDKL